MVHDPLHPWQFAVGGDCAAVLVYDLRRMSLQRPSWEQSVTDSAWAGLPVHMAGASWPPPSGFAAGLRATPAQGEEMEEEDGEGQEDEEDLPRRGRHGRDGHDHPSALGRRRRGLQGGEEGGGPRYIFPADSITSLQPRGSAPVRVLQPAHMVDGPTEPHVTCVSYSAR